MARTNGATLGQPVQVDDGAPLKRTAQFRLQVKPDRQEIVVYQELAQAVDYTVPPIPTAEYQENR